jgi:hypothetical protein
MAPVDVSAPRRATRRSASPMPSFSRCRGDPPWMRLTVLKGHDIERHASPSVRVTRSCLSQAPWALQLFPTSPHLSGSGLGKASKLPRRRIRA